MRRRPFKVDEVAARGMRSKTRGQLSADQRKLLAGIVNRLMPSLNQLFDNVLTVPGVAELLKPTIEPFGRNSRC
jgi:hypothetical protein